MEDGPARAVRIVLAHDDSVVSASLASRLAMEFEIVGIAADADDAIALAEAHQPDAAVVDVEMPHGDGLRAAREIRKQAPRTAIVALSVDMAHARLSRSTAPAGDLA